MSNPYNGSKIGKRGGRHDRPSRKPKIDGQDVSLVRALDKMTGRHLIEPETLGDPTANAAKYREVSHLEETREEFIVPRRSKTQTEHLRLYPIWSTDRQVRTVKRLALCQCGHLGHDGYCKERLTLPDGRKRYCDCLSPKAAILADTTLTVGGVEYPAVTIHNEHTIGRPETSLLVPGNPFPIIKETPTRGNHFPTVDPYTKRIRYTGHEVDETMPVFESVTEDGADLDFYKPEDE